MDKEIDSANLVNIKQKILGLIIDGSKPAIPKVQEPPPPPPVISANCEKTILTSDAVDVSGWAFSKDGIKTVEISIDNVLLDNAVYGCLRQDIHAAFPEVADSLNAGFCLFRRLEPQLSEGVHTLDVKITSNDGHIDSRRFQMDVGMTYDAYSHDNPTVIIHCDRALLDVNSIDMTGFALSPVHIDVVEVYIDDIFIKSASTGIHRRDAASMFPCYSDCASSGFCLYYEFDPPVEEGTHTVSIKTATKNGITDSRQLTLDAVKDVEPNIDIVCDWLAFGTDAVEINGYAVSSKNISSVEIFIDEEFVGYAFCGLPRMDIVPKYPCYATAKDSGLCFFKRFDKPIPPGIHTLALRAVTERGHVKLQTLQVDVALTYETLTDDRPNIFINCDTELLTYDVIEVAGWAVAPDGIKELQVYIDGVFIDNAIFGSPSPGVEAKFPCYKDSADAWFCMFKTLESPLCEGEHSITLRALCNNGQHSTLEMVSEAAESYRAYAAQNPTFIAGFETCLITCERILLMAWIVTPAGLATAEIFVDGEFAGYASGINTRNDIAAQYPCYKHKENLLTCFDEILSTPISTGGHVLTLKATAQDGQIMSWNFESADVQTYADYLMSTAPQVLIKLEKAAMSLDFIEIKGWALSPDAIDTVEVYLDNGLVDSAFYGIERGDMKETFPLHQLYKDGANCGFCLNKKLDIPLQQGYHTIKVTAISKTGLIASAYEYNYINRPYSQLSCDAEQIIISCDKLSITLDVIEVEGWAASPDGIGAVEVHIDGAYIDKAFHGISTQEIGRLLPCYKDSRHSGFVLYNAYDNRFTAGDHTVTLKIISVQGLVRHWSTRYFISDSYEKYLRKVILPSVNEITGIMEGFSYRPRISVITPVYNVAPLLLDKCIESVIKQYYGNWELCIYDDASSRRETVECLHRWKESDARIKIAFGKENMHISGATNEALRIADGEFIALLDNDDELTPDALYEIVKLLNENPALDFIYSDEDKLEKDGALSDPFFKPDWSPELFCSMMYTCHLGVFRKSIIDNIGGFRKGYEGSQDYDMVLRFVEHSTPQRIAHIPKALYHWRKIYGSASESTEHKTYAFDSAVKALKDFMDRNSIEGQVINENNTGLYRIKRKLKETPLVSIVIPTKDKVQYLGKCMESLLEKTDYPNVEIMILDTGSVEAATHEYYDKTRHNDTITIIDYPNREFSYAEANNWAAERASGAYLLFLNNDTEVIEPQWLSAMMEYGQMPDVGAVGAKLLYPDNGIQHMGVVVGLKRAASHIGRLYPDGRPMGFPFLHAKDAVRNVTAVTGACLLMRKDLFFEMNGFDVKFRIAFNDIDLCLRVRKQGYKIIYTPYAKLYHHESVSVGKPYEDTSRCPGLFEAEVDLFRQRWDIDNYIDPYFNKNLDESLRFKY